jgi:DNA repair exonuclease SbcCD ATPase subunit
VGVKRLRKTKGAKAKRAAEELRPGDVAWVLGFEESSKARLGKPTLLGDDELVERRGTWDHLLESYWGAIGWELKCARSLEDIEKAFQPLGGQPANYLIAPFLRNSIETATVEYLRKTRDERSAVGAQLNDAEDRRNKQAELVNQAKGAVLELSQENVEQLQREVKWREENIRTIRIRLSNKKAEIRRAELSLEQGKVENQEALQAQIRSLGFELQKIETEYSEEKKILQQIEDRLHAITPERQKMAAEILGQHEVVLDAMEKAAKEARRKWEELEKRLTDQEAYYSRAEAILLHPQSGQGWLSHRLQADPSQSCGRQAGCVGRNRSAGRNARCREERD